MKAIRVPKPRAEQAKDELVRRGLFDGERRVEPAGDAVEIPVRATPPEAVLDALDAELVDGAGTPRTWFRDPRDRIRRRLERTWSGDPDRMPNGWVRLGDVLVVDLDDDLPDEATLARILAEELEACAVLDVDRIEGELRRPRARHVWGDEDTETVHREHGLTYVLDPAEVMFSPGNKAERGRIREMDLDGRTVVDLFAGVGQLALPAAAAGASVIACEKNPAAAAYLRDNAVRNGLDDRVEVREGDCRDVAPSDVADVVLMGLLPDSTPFLDVARRTLGGSTGELLLHTVCTAGTWPDAPDGTRLVDRRVVKHYGPSRDHVVLHLEVPA